MLLALTSDPSAGCSFAFPSDGLSYLTTWMSGGPSLSFPFLSWPFPLFPLPSGMPGTALSHARTDGRAAGESASSPTRPSS